MKENILRDKTYAFAISIVRVCESIIAHRKEFVLTKQLLRSGTAIGALVREAEFAQSRADFVNKMSIALKEANETLYWISLLKDTNYLDEIQFQNLSSGCSELVALLVSSVKTAKATL